MIYPLVLAKSIFTGFTMCLPIGPISILVIRKTIRYNKRIAFMPCIGSAIADIFYGSITGFGVSAIANFFNKHIYYFQLFAATILLFLAVRILRKPPEKLHIKNGKKSIIKNFSLGFFLALLNPTTLFFMTAILAAIGLHIQANNPIFSINIILGLFVGEILWWLFLINVTALAKKHLGEKAPALINTASGLFLLCMSVFIIIKTTLY